MCEKNVKPPGLFIVRRSEVTELPGFQVPPHTSRSGTESLCIRVLGMQNNFRPLIPYTYRIQNKKHDPDVENDWRYRYCCNVLVIPYGFYSNQSFTGIRMESPVSASFLLCSGQK